MCLWWGLRVVQNGRSSDDAYAPLIGPAIRLVMALDLTLIIINDHDIIFETCTKPRYRILRRKVMC